MRAAPCPFVCMLLLGRFAVPYMNGIASHGTAPRCLMSLDVFLGLPWPQALNGVACHPRADIVQHSLLLVQLPMQSKLPGGAVWV